MKSTGIYKNKNRSIALCYNAVNVKLIQEFHTAAKIKILPVLIKICKQACFLSFTLPCIKNRYQAYK